LNLKRQKNKKGKKFVPTIILLDRKLLLEKEECNIKSNFNAGNFNQSADEFFCHVFLNFRLRQTFVDS
jgi:hypothetical protein